MGSLWYTLPEVMYFCLTVFTVACSNSICEVSIFIIWVNRGVCIQLFEGMRFWCEIFRTFSKLTKLLEGFTLFTFYLCFMQLTHFSSFPCTESLLITWKLFNCDLGTMVIYYCNETMLLYSPVLGNKK